VACKELEFVLTLWLVINIGVCVDTVACKDVPYKSLCLHKHQDVLLATVSTQIPVPYKPPCLHKYSLWLVKK
jgi:hypothetical protein